MPTAEAKYFLTAEDRTRRAFRSVTRRFGKATKTAAKFGAALTALIGGAFGKFANDVLNNGQQIGRLSKELGVSTENLSEMQGVLRRLGLEFDGYIDGIRTMQERLQELRDGTPSVVEAFKRMGLAARDFEGLTGDEQIALLIKRLSAMGDITRRNATALEIFGDEAGKVFIRLAGEGPRAIEKLRKEQERLGNSFSQRETDKLTKFAETISMLGDALRGAFTQSLLENFDEIVANVKSLAESLPAILEFGAALAKIASFGIKGGKELLSIPIQAASAGIGAAGALAQGRTVGARFEAATGLTKIAESLRNLQELTGVQLPENIDNVLSDQFADLIGALAGDEARQQREIQIDLQRDSNDALRKIVREGVVGVAG